MDLYEYFSSEGVSSDCICSLPIERRLNRNGMTFAKADCDFATLQIEGPYFRYNYPPHTKIEDMELGFKIDFHFDWHKLTLSTELPDPNKSIIMRHDITFGGSTVLAYCPEYEGYIYHQKEYPHIELTINYVTN